MRTPCTSNCRKVCLQSLGGGSKTQNQLCRTPYAYSNATSSHRQQIYESLNGTQIRTSKTLASKLGKNGTASNATSRWSPTAFVSWYEAQLTQYPLVTKALTGGLIAAGGDFFCQTVLEEPEGDGQSALEAYDPSRTFRFAFLGTCFVAPTNHIWYRFLAKHAAPGKTWSSAFKRTALDQFGWTPIYTVIWLSSLWKMEGSSNADIGEALRREYIGVMKANWLLWIPAQLANFKLVPLKYQVLFTNVVELVWNAFLSYAATGKGEDKETGNSRKNRKRRQTVNA